MVLEVGGLPHTSFVNGTQQVPIEGVSMEAGSLMRRSVRDVPVDA